MHARPAIPPPSLYPRPFAPHYAVFFNSKLAISYARIIIAQNKIRIWYSRSKLGKKRVCAKSENNEKSKTDALRQSVAKKRSLGKKREPETQTWPLPCLCSRRSLVGSEFSDLLSWVSRS